jgi:hemerythrin-like domain-containing protein
MNAIELLEEQHREVEDLFQQIDDTNDDDARQALFDELADAIAVHAAIEERHFYPAAYREATEDLLRESVEEHLAMKRVVADLLELSPSDEAFNAKCRVLRDIVDRHVEEEEGVLFPQARRMLGPDILDELGDEMQETAEELREQGAPRREIPLETAHAPSLE